MQRDTTTVVCMVATVAVAAALAIWFNKPKRVMLPAKTPRKYIGGDVSFASNTPPPRKRRKARSVSFSEPVVTHSSDYKESPKGLRRSTRHKSPFTIESNNGAGDCLFYCFKRSIKEFNVTTTVKELRGIVAESITDDQFSVLKIIYDGAKEENEYQVLNDYNFMAGVNTITDLRGVIVNTKKYWGDEMAIRALENASGISAVVITKDLKGRATVANKLDNQDESERKWYTLLLLENTHYQSILYKNKAVLNKEELEVALSILGNHILNYI